uniref:Uncharacterized protein n=1 Tax=viral metagenome TaxID=1070528 RepID=A0A6M3LWG1_9ZZZZ
MGWDNDEYTYSSRVLRIIAESYIALYDGVSFRVGQILTDPLGIAEFRADFDNALSSIGSKWRLNGSDFKHYHKYSPLQRAVIADIFDIPDSDLMKSGFYDIKKMKVIAYSKMKRFLNGDS